MDTQADRYFLVPEEIGPALLRLWNCEPAEERDLRDLGRLKSTGVVVTDCEAPRRNFNPSTIILPSSELTELEPTQRRRIDAARAAAYQLKAWLGIRMRPMFEILADLGPTSALPDSTEAADARLLPIAAAFRATTGIFRQQDQCLPRSIAFKRMCMASGLRVSLVIGVTLDPFSAHAWVQSGGRVLNDTLERVRCFTPIFSA
ncbi:lasso peptide biosynthesis B2 protein [Sphingobium sp.]|uniref:lasso peptide biosynthesis B2 protein n=1 Tax=Sphingobium sp. TaxID=1912891 RepID=UPI00257B452F|nr:lasso peptide biosynthesis B2 protein [Sphingobium sp.]